MEMKNIMNRKNFIDKNGHKNNQKKVKREEKKRCERSKPFE